MQQQVQKSLMPKGVDHFRWAVQDRPSGRTVQKSLMPKGVDHMKLDEIIRFDELPECKNL